MREESLEQRGSLTVISANYDLSDIGNDKRRHRKHSIGQPGQCMLIMRYVPWRIK
jgi:hypothetical protein